MAEGASERELARLGSLYGLLLRVSVVVLTGVFSVILTWRTAGPVAAATAWCMFQVWWRARRPAAVWLAAVDVVMVFMVGLSQVYLGPQPTSSWVFAVASITTVTGHFEWTRRPLVGWAVAGSGVVGYQTGHLLAAPGQTSLLWLPLIVQCLLTWISMVFIRGGARAADRIAGLAAERRRKAMVVTARLADEREYLAMLHDTVSTTLLTVSSGSADSDKSIRERVRRDLDILLAAQTTQAHETDLSSLLERLGDQPGMRMKLDIHGPLVLPGTPAFAILLGVQEALNNVLRHAGDTIVWLCAERDKAGRVVVNLRDRGRGFRPADVSEHRRGISGSIVGRMRSVGGTASVTSEVGMGTAVCWMWPDG